jgi:hypothetical protein
MIWFAEDLSGNGIIESGEKNLLLDRISPTSGGLSVLVRDSADRFYSTTGRGGFGEPAQTDIQSFTIPGDPLNTTASATTFAALNSPYVSTAVFNTANRPFDAYHRDGATLIVAAYDDFFGRLDYLLTLKPWHPSRVKQWSLY